MMEDQMAKHRSRNGAHWLVVRALAVPLASVMVMMAAPAARAACSITGPAQPATGPNGSDYANSGYTRVAFTSNGVTNYIFQPSPRPATPLPVVAYLHGYSFTTSNVDAKNAGELIHLARKGYIVIWPQFQPSAFTFPWTFESNAAKIIKDGLAYLGSNAGTMAQPAKYSDGAVKFALAGYSVGGATAINLAANYAANGIPRPRALATWEANNGGGSTTPMRNAKTIPSDTNVLMVMAEADDANTLKTSSDAWNQMAQVPASNKQWIGVYSDSRPNCAAENLVADHGFPLSDPANVDALDIYGIYKWGVALFNYTFAGSDYDYWKGGGFNQNHMGLWSDGVPVRQAAGSASAFWPNH
jgi:poly(3-hydroxybutyrate) depolymerase